MERDILANSLSKRDVKYRRMGCVCINEKASSSHTVTWYARNCEGSLKNVVGLALSNWLSNIRHPPALYNFGFEIVHVKQMADWWHFKICFKIPLTLRTAHTFLYER